MSINFKQPKYILPLIFLPFFFLFFFVYHSGFAKKKTETNQQTGINGTVGEVSPEIKKKVLADKLDAYRNTFKEGDGLTAVNALPARKRVILPTIILIRTRKKRCLIRLTWP